jgi:restriction system protein
MARQRKNTTGPQFTRFFGPVIEALKQLGGSGRPSEVVDLVAANLNISEAEQNEELKGGGLRYSNQVHWARFYLAKAGYVDSSKRGVWSLTEKGQATSLTPEDALRIFTEVQQGFPDKPAKKNISEVKQFKMMEEVEELLPPESETDYRTTLINIMKELPASGFERLCQRLLRESGFQSVVVTGRTGDGGIDGHGVLQVNPFVSFRVLFQCKRYGGNVNASQVRDFRGAMMGRTDNGIIMTTGGFSADAKNEAAREGVPPIELVDGEKLLDMFEYLELGLTPKTTYEVNREFFDEFK